MTQDPKFFSWGTVRKGLERNPSHIVLLLICVLSRLLSSLDYMEDPESLNFAMCSFEDISNPVIRQQFISNPLFCVIGKVLFQIFGNFSLLYSLLGGISLYVIIIYILKFLNLPLLSLEGILIAVLLFFNPLIWISSNHYLPDLPATAVLLAALYYLVPADNNGYGTAKGWLLTGVLAGLKLSFLPFLLPACVFAIIVKKKVLQSLLFLVAGAVIWILPLFLVFQGKDMQDLLTAAASHYTEFWRSHLTEGPGAGRRFISLLHDLWAIGMGGFWPGRTFALLFNSAGIAACSFFGFFILLNFGFDRMKMFVIFLSCLVYLVWIFLFENITTQALAVLPFLPFISILFAYGVIYFLVNFNYVYIKVLMLVLMLAVIFNTIVLVVQHTYPTPIAQAKEYILNRREAGQRLTIVSMPQINRFMSFQKVRAKYVELAGDSISELISDLKKTEGKVIFICDSPLPSCIRPENIIHFRYNQYVNKACTDIYLYEF